jgi:hypothetical protein
MNLPRHGTTTASSSTDASSPEPVTVMVGRTVAPGREPDFEAWLRELLAAATSFPGFLGSGVLRPHRPGAPWHVVYRFTDEASQQRWEQSPERAEWLTRGDALMDEKAVHRVTGLETWFALPGRTADSPPRWKVAVVAFPAIFPLALIINATLIPQIASWPLPARVLVLSSILTPLMTWVVMPNLTRLLSGWLYPD